TEQFAQNASPGAGVGKIREEAWMVPMRYSGNDDLVQVPQHQFHGLRIVWRQWGKLFADIARLDLRQHGKTIRISEIVRDPIHEAVSPLPELVRRHIRRFQCRHNNLLTSATE